MSANNGGPAFPGYGMTGRGMTLRDYFAAKAMQGEMARTEIPIASIVQCAAYYYEIADAMIEARGEA